MSCNNILIIHARAARDLGKEPHAVGKRKLVSEQDRVASISLKIFVGTWNMGENPAGRHSGRSIWSFDRKDSAD